ncbi:MAG: hypothetical protein ACWGON_07695 [Gemmatimonadota bacterium]
MSRRPTARWVVLAALAGTAPVAAGCGGGSAVPESTGRMERVVQGTIRQVGGMPNVSTRIETGVESVVLVGELAVELARAAGAVARVYGTTVADGADRIQVQSYELLSVDGRTPLVGVLDTYNGAIVLRDDDGTVAELAGGTARMREAAGSRVWVTTREDGRTIVRWGILRPVGS